MNNDLQTCYQEAEKAYGNGNYSTAQALTQSLLNSLDASADPEHEDAVLGWRAMAALLLGHIELYGFNNPIQAALQYQLVLNSRPQETQAELAQQGLSRCDTRNTSPEISQGATDLLTDPFLDAAATTNSQTRVVSNRSSAMPWLEDTALATTSLQTTAAEPTANEPPRSSSPVSPPWQQEEMEEPPPSPEDSPPAHTPEPEAPEQEPDAGNILHTSNRPDATSKPETDKSPKANTIPNDPAPEQRDQEPAEPQREPPETAHPRENKPDPAEDILEGASLRVRVRTQPEESLSVPAEQTGPRSWLTQLKRLSGRR